MRLCAFSRLGSKKMTAQSRIDWLKQRQSGIGGSEIAAIVGLNQYTTPMQVWESKVNPEAFLLD